MSTNAADARTDLPEGRHAIAGWLLACCGLVAAIAVVGAATRLTGSGLSIVVWEPIIGIIPPLSDQAWREAFDLYRQFPEYQQRNLGMSLEEFRYIFWWEYWHRVLGRLIGLVFLIGFAYFLLTRRLGRALTLKLTGLLALGGLQGVLGWYMVASGLVDVPQVSQYRLTAHLGLAFLIFALMLWVALDLLRPRAGRPRVDEAIRGLRRGAWALAGLVGVTVLSGGLVAGTRAGFIYNTFPTMHGDWIPPTLFAIDPAWLNLFENPVTIQFVHRWLALAVFVAIMAWWLVSLRRPLAAAARIAAHALLAAAVLQVALGIATLLLQVPIALAVAHQAGALALLTAVVIVCHLLYPVAHDPLRHNAQSAAA